MELYWHDQELNWIKGSSKWVYVAIENSFKYPGFVLHVDIKFVFSTTCTYR
jgi:hypothetical protein